MYPGLPRIASLTAGQSQCIFCYYFENLNKVEEVEVGSAWQRMIGVVRQVLEAMLVDA